MTPKEQAKEIIGRLEYESYCLYCVNKIISANPHSNQFIAEVKSTMKYWLSVRKGIKKHFKK
jgi:hypothetical protein